MSHKTLNLHFSHLKYKFLTRDLWRTTSWYVVDIMDNTNTFLNETYVFVCVEREREREREREM